MKEFSRTFFKKIALCFWDVNILVIIFAGFITYALVHSDADWLYFMATRNATLDAFLFPAAIIGAFAPLLLPLCIWLFARTPKTKTLAWAIAQAELIALFVTSFLKVFSGRIQPNLHDTINDISREFNFGFLHHGFFWGWPSSHTAVAFAMATTWALLRPKNKTLGLLVYLYAFYIGIGVSVSIHWFSDFVAGAMIGVMVGRIVSRGFERARA